MNGNKLYIAAAGSGKTTFLVNHAIDQLELNDTRRIAIITFTQNNQVVIKKRLQQQCGYIPSNIQICGWFSFLLDFCIRPFMGAVIEELRCKNVGLLRVKGVSGTQKVGDKYYKTYKSGDLKKKFLTDDNRFYSDKLSEFAYMCHNIRKKNFTKHIESIFSSILIDEVQDLSSWDYDIIKILLKIQNVSFVLCGDLRQKTYSTTDAQKWHKYKGRIDNYLINEVNRTRKNHISVDVSTLNKSHRFGHEIAKFASFVIGPNFAPTEACDCDKCKSRQNSFCDSKGMFLIKNSDVLEFVNKYNPLVLFWDKTFNPHIGTKGANYGEAKGMTDDVCLIFPTKSIIDKLLSSETNRLSELTRSKLYVAITRSRYISAIVVDDNFKNTIIGLPFWKNHNR